MDAPKQTIDVYVSYLYFDGSAPDELFKRLVPLEQKEDIFVHKAGIIEPERAYIEQPLIRPNQAQLIIPILSSSYLSGNPRAKSEIERIIHVAEDDNITVIPILLTDISAESSPFAKFQTLPINGIPITKWKNQDEAWDHVTEEITKVIHQLQSNEDLSTDYDQPIGESLEEVELPNEPTRQLKQLVVKRLMRGEIEEAVDTLNTSAQYYSSDVRNTLIMLKSRLSRINQERIKGMIADQDFQMERNRITEVILKMTEDMEDVNVHVKVSEIRGLIANGETGNALHELLQLTANEITKQQYQNLIQLNIQYQGLQGQLEAGLLPSSDAQLQENRITMSLLSILDEITHDEPMLTKASAPAKKAVSVETEDRELTLQEKIQAILNEPIEDLFPIIQVEAIFGDMFVAKGDLIIIPCDTEGNLSPSIEDGLKRIGAKHSRKKRKLGSFHIQTQKNAPAIGYAVTASLEELSSLTIIENIARSIGEQSEIYTRIICPLIGTGLGNPSINKVAAYQVLKRGFQQTATSDATFHIHIIDQKVYDAILAAEERENAVKRPSYNSDSTKGEDQLDITHEVEAFANLIASEDLQPPLSIGVFGNWGTGKSFFMEKLLERVDEISLESSVSEASTGIAKRIVQIKFNAWYYVDANLWASIVTTIFAELSRYLNPQTAEEKAEISLYQTLASTKKQVAIAQEEISKLDAEIKTIEVEIGNIEKIREEKRNTLENFKLKHIFTPLKNDEEVNKLIEEAKKTLPFQELQYIDRSARESINEVNSIIDRYTSTSGRATEILRSLFAFKGNIKFFLILIILILVPIAAYQLLESLGSELWEEVAQKIGQALAVVTGLITTVGYSIKHFSKESDKVLKQVNQGINYLDKARLRMEYIRDQSASEENEKLKILQHSYEQLNEEHQKAIAQKWSAKKKMELVKNEIEEIKEGKRLESFIHRRLDSNDYQKHLGLISLIRADFDRLSLYLQKNRSEDSVKEVFSQIEAQDQIDRIVLYIDDLDRCPPEMVVNVLQAIHLILAFPLFVVVVGVDVRWVSKSLLMKYGKMFYDQDDGLADDPELRRELQGNATPFDYLEKIFQIPFRLKTITEKDKRKYLNYLLRNDIEAITLEQLSEPITVDSSTHITVEHTSDDEVEEVTPAEVAETTNEGDNVAVVKEIQIDESKNEEIVAEVAVQETVVRWDLVKISQEEMEFIQALSEIAGNSPRSIKRFVNIARLLKSNRRWRPATKVKNTKSYQACLLLLAVIIGLPRMTPLLLKLLQDESESTATDRAETLGQLVQKYEEKSGEDIDRYNKLNVEWDIFTSFLLNIKDHPDNNIKAMFLMDVEHLNNLAPLVSRFSFRSMQTVFELEELVGDEE
ncbi:MAG: P-loop NTPase fold protein [Bacteroidota bacterium]